MSGFQSATYNEVISTRVRVCNQSSRVIINIPQDLTPPFALLKQADDIIEILSLIARK